MPPGAPAAAPIAWNTLDDMLASDSKLQQLQYMRELRVFDDKPLHEESLAVLAARVGEARSDFLSALLQAGVDAIGDRQLFANALVRGVREGRITRGWAKPPPETCAYCGSVPATNKKLLTCGRCKSARYCNASCQKAHWGAGHKAACKPPAATPSSDWAKVVEGGIEAEHKQAYDEKVGAGGYIGAPILADGHSKMVNGVVTDTRE